jgi:hypothetical protein
VEIPGAVRQGGGHLYPKEDTNMKKTRILSMLGAAFLLISALASCGGKPAAMNDIPVYPGAVEMKAGTNPIGDTLSQNEKTDAAMRQAMNAGGKMEQRAWELPAGVAWPEVKAFYEEKLKAADWQSGLGGAAGGFVDVNKMMDVANQSNPLSQTMIFTKGKQSLTLLMVALPMKKEGKQLILSLTTN